MAVRLSRNVWIGGGVVVAAGLAVGVGWLLAGPSGGAESEPTPRVTVTAEADDPTPEPSETVDPYEGDLDGILADEYPEAAPARTDPNPAREGGYFNVDYPDALVLEDWVWDRVGAGWQMQVVSSPLDWADDEWVQPAAVLYLVSPEDVYFEVGELPERMWADARVVSWVEDAEYVRLTWSYYEGGRYDLRTGASEDLEFAVHGASSEQVHFVTANADGDELWRAASKNGYKYYRWDASTDEWAASALVDALPDADAIDPVPGAMGRHAVSPDGDTVVLAEYRDNEFGSRERTGTFAVYDLSEDRLTPVDIPALADEFHFDHVEASEDSVRLTRSPYGEPSEFIDIDYASGAVTEGTADAAPADPEPDATWDGLVGWGEPTDAEAAWVDCGC